MELILNELSFEGQFRSNDDFADYFQKVLAPLLDIIIENKIPLLKKADIYNHKIVDDKTLEDLLRVGGDPVITSLRTRIVSLAYSHPYWDNEMMSCVGVDYDYPAIAKEPNCFTEVIERRGKLISLQHSTYNADEILCKRNNEQVVIRNITEVKTLLKEYLLENRTTIRYILEKYPYSRLIRCVQIDGKCHAEEALLDNNLETNDFVNIIESIQRLIDDFERGRKSDLWDKLQDDVFELRMHVSANRIFRLLFVQREGLYFLNGFIKKRQKTPQAEIDKAIRIKRQME